MTILGSISVLSALLTFLSSSGQAQIFTHKEICALGMDGARGSRIMRCFEQ